MAVSAVSVLLVCLAAALPAVAPLTYHQGGYNQLQIALSPQTPLPANCSMMLDHFETIVRESSRMLHQATDGRAFIRTVTVVLPAGWGPEVALACKRNATPSRIESYNDADVRVSANPHPLFSGADDALWTQQSRDCGQPGDFISAGPEFFFRNAAQPNASDVWIRGRRFLREFAKFRYGVFDVREQTPAEHDGLFPGFFCPPAIVSNATVSNATGRSIPFARSECDPVTNCINSTAASTNSSSSSSSGNSSSLPMNTATNFCNASNHDDLAPTQHNLLCNGQSARDVVFSHPDLKSSNGQVFNRLETVFHYKQSAQPRYVLALDKSSPMDERDHWKYVRSATRRLVLHDLADDTELGILSFADTVQIHTDGHIGPMVRLGSAGSREQVASAIPVFISTSNNGATSSSQESCLTCALSEAIVMLERSGSSCAGDVIILITSGSASADQAQSALALAARKQVRVSVVAFAYVPTPGAHQSGALRNLQNLAEATGGRMTAVASRGVGTMSHISMLIELGDALVATLDYHQGSDRVPALVHEQEFGSESASGWVNGSFYMDPSLGRDTVMAVYFYSRDFNTHVGDIRLVSPDGIEHRGISETAMASLYVTPLVTIDKPGVWRYSFDRRSQSHQSHFVKVTSKLRARSTGSVRGPLTAKLRVIPPAVGDAPFILLATVKSGELPVLDARVRATIQFTGTSANHDASNNNTLVLDLYDNGNSDPDITRGDGVYSRYFGKYFRGAGTYSITLSVDAMDGRAYTIRSSSLPNPFDALECCGSLIRVPLERRELTGAFSRLVPGGIISAGSASTQPGAQSSTVNATSSGLEAEPVDILPPSRISDLRVHVDPTTQRVTFQWTAVGEDFDVGTAYTYEMRLTTNKTLLRSAGLFQQGEAVPVSAPRPSGEPMDLTLTNFERYDQYFYAAVRAVDKRGNRGRVSNIVQLWMPRPPTTTAAPSTVWPATLSVNDMAPQWFPGTGLTSVHWITIAASSFFLLLVCVLIAYFVCVARRKKDKEQNTKNGPPKFAYVPTTVNSTLYPTAPETKSASTADLTSRQPTKEILSQYQSGAVTIYDGRTVPVHWSASQLLQEHERRHSPYGQNEMGDHYPAPNDSAFMSGSYHLNSGSAIYGGLVHPEHQQQSVYVQSSASVTPPSADYRPYSVDYEGSSSVEHDGGYYPQNNNTKSRPPTFPKPAGNGRLMSHLPLHGSFTSLASERKKRNVTQV